MQKNTATTTVDAAAKLPLPSEQIILRGSTWTFAYALNANGKMLAKEFLDDRKQFSLEQKAQLDDIFSRVSCGPRIIADKHFKQERGKIYGVDLRQLRLALFQCRDVWFVTHAFIKKKRRWPETEFGRAEQIRKSQLERFGVKS